MHTLEKWNQPRRLPFNPFYHFTVGYDKNTKIYIKLKWFGKLTLTHVGNIISMYNLFWSVRWESLGFFFSIRFALFIPFTGWIRFLCVRTLITESSLYGNTICVICLVKINKIVCMRVCSLIWRHNGKFFHRNVPWVYVSFVVSVERLYAFNVGNTIYLLTQSLIHFFSSSYANGLGPGKYDHHLLNYLTCK